MANWSTSTMVTWSSEANTHCVTDTQSCTSSENFQFISRYKVCSQHLYSESYFITSTLYMAPLKWWMILTPCWGIKHHHLLWATWFYGMVYQALTSSYHYYLSLLVMKYCRWCHVDLETFFMYFWYWPIISMGFSLQQDSVPNIKTSLLLLFYYAGFSLMGRWGEVPPTSQK